MRTGTGKRGGGGGGQGDGIGAAGVTSGVAEGVVVLVEEGDGPLGGHAGQVQALDHDVEVGGKARLVRVTLRTGTCM